MNDAEIVIPNLDRVAFLDLQKTLGADHVEQAGREQSGDVHGELLSATAIVTVTPVLVGLLAKWILKYRKLELEVTRKQPGGGEETIKLKFESGKAKEDKEGLLDRITKALTKALFDEPAAG